MPCSSSDVYDEINEKARKEYEDKLTRMLCSICTKLEAERRPDIMNEEEREWFEEHKEWDKRRIAIEKEWKDREVKARNADKTA